MFFLNGASYCKLALITRLLIEKIWIQSLAEEIRAAFN